MRKLSNTFVALLFAANLAAGCASHRTVRDETVEYPASDTTTATDENGRVVEQRTETSEEHEHRGILGTTVDFLGEVIAFPFRLVGGVISAIF